VIVYLHDLRGNALPGNILPHFHIEKRQVSDDFLTHGRRYDLMAVTGLKEVNEILEDRKGHPNELIEVLQDIQESCGYLPEDYLKELSDKLNVPLIEVYRVANFYKAFKLQPCGKYLVTVCMGTACHVRGAERIVEETLTRLKIGFGETTVDNLFTVETVNCLGACALGPVVVVNGEYHDHMTPQKMDKLLTELAKSGAE
jgi:NADH:ubiquinone oxidoreductase subunit E